MPLVGNPSGKHRPKRRHPGDGTVIRRKDRYPPGHPKAGQPRWRRKPWVAVVPLMDGSGRTMWLSAGSRDEAERLRADAVVRRDKQLVRSPETVGDYVTAWLETVEVGPGTWPRYRQHVTERILPAFGATPLDELTPAAVRRALLDWEGSPQTRGGTLRLLRAAMKQAVADRRIEHDPTSGIPYPPVRRHDPVTLDADEARHLMATVAGERFAPILVLSLGLGVRRGEALGLRTSDINWEGPRPISVTIAKSLRYIAPSMRLEGEGPYRLTGTKTGETRTVPLPAFVAEALRERLAERDQEQRAAKVWAPNDFVFCDPVGNSVPLETLRTWYLGALKRAGLPPIRWHSLRATTVTLLLDAGVDLLTIQRIVGHASLDTTRMYVGKTPGAMASAAAKIDEVIG